MTSKGTMNNKDNGEGRPARISLAGILITAVFLALAGVLVFLARWAFITWPGLRMDEIIFQLRAPLEGTGDGLILKGVLNSILPAAAILLIYSLTLLGVRTDKRRATVLLVSRILSAVMIIGALGTAYTRLDAGNFLKNQFDKSDFIEEHYVDA
ncbi:MAG: hypothetical protein Q4F25_04600, partial [Eubacteriales bacterium]|nr:hypothetical protein [Eubacteriales bacterium]